MDGDGGNRKVTKMGQIAVQSWRFDDFSGFHRKISGTCRTHGCSSRKKKYYQ